MSSDGLCAEPPGDVTLASYEAAADLYRQRSVRPGPAVKAYLDELARRVGGGTVLELGSGPGWDADHLESRGVQVLRTDAVPAFVRMLHADGHRARRLDVRFDDLGGPYDAVLADAVLLHLTRAEFRDVLDRAAVGVGGLLAFTLKEGEGDGWTQAELGLPRHFTYWREAEVRTALHTSGWEVVPRARRRPPEPWLHVMARAVAAAQ